MLLFKNNIANREKLPDPAIEISFDVRRIKKTVRTSVIFFFVLYWAFLPLGSVLVLQIADWRIALQPEAEFAEAQVSANIIVAWPYASSSIPAGWYRDPTLDGYFPLMVPTAATNPGTTGGATTHTHTQSHTHTQNSHTHAATNTAAGNAGSACDNSPNDRIVLDTHTHPIAQSDATIAVNQNDTTTSDSGSNLPPYREMLWIYSNGTADIPHGAIAFFNSSSLPSGWVATTTGLFYRGAVAGNDPSDTTQGSDTHSHTLSHNHTQNSHTHTTPATATAQATANNDLNTTGSALWGDTSHTHGITWSSATATNQASDANIVATSSWPVHYGLVAIQNNTGGADAPHNIIGLWRGTIASIPSEWAIADGNNGTPNLLGKFVNATSTANLGKTGGFTESNHTATAHTHTQDAHSHTLTIAAASGTAQKSGGTGANCADHATHTHSGSVSANATATNQNTTITVGVNTDIRPPFYEVAFVEYHPPVRVTGNVYDDEATGDFTACDDATKNVTAVIGTSTPGQFSNYCANSGNAFTISLSGTSSLSAGTPIIVYIDGVSSTFGSTVTKYNSGDITGITVRKNRLIVKNQATASTTDNTNLGIWDNANDTDVNYDVSGTTLVLESGQKLIASGDDTFAPGGVASTTAGGSSPGGDVQIDSGATLNMGTNDLRVGGDLMNFGTLTLSAGQTTYFNGSRAGGNSFASGASGVSALSLQGVTIGGSVVITASSSFTAAQTLTVNSGSELALRSGKFATSSSTFTLNGTVSGSGTMVLTDTSTGPGTAGSITSSIRFSATDADIASTVLDARTGASGTGYGGLVEIYSGSASARNAIFAAGTYDFNAGLAVVAAGTGNMTLLGTPNFPTVNISATNGLDYTGAGAGTEFIYSGTGTWTNSGNTDFTSGVFIASSTNTFVMDGTSKTLTNNQQGFGNLTLSGSITTSNGASTTGDLILSGTIILGGTASTSGNATLSGTIYPQNQAVILNGPSKTLTGGGTVGGLIVRGSYTLGTADLTVGTSTIITGASTTIPTGRILTSTSSIVVTGTLDGNGTTTIQHSGLSGAGSTNSHIRYDASGGNITMAQRTYGGNVEVFNSNAAARTVTMAAGTHTINGPAGLYVKSSSGDILLDGATNSSASTIAQDLKCASGGGTKTISTGSTANTWAVSGNVDFTNCTYTAGSGNTLSMGGTSKTLTSNSQALTNFTISGGSVSLADNLSASGNLTVSGGTFADNGRLITLSGTSKNIDLSGGAQTLNNLRISGTYSVVNNDLTISTSTIDTAKSLTVGTGRTLIATSTLTLQGTADITGGGTTTFGNSSFACSNINTIQGSGLLSSNVRADLTSGNCTIPVRVFGSNLEFYSNSGSARTATLTTGSSTVSQDMLLNAANTANLTVTAAASTEMHITRNLDYVGAGAGSENIDHTSSIWYVSGNADFTGGVFTAPTASSTWIMNGSSKTLTAVAPFDNLDLPGTITLASTASTTGDLILSGTLTTNGNTVRLISTDAANIRGGSNSIPSLWVRGPYTLAASDFTVGTSTIDTGQSLTVGSGRTLISTSTMTLNGTLAGTGQVNFGNTLFACSNVPSGGTISVGVLVEATAGDCTLSARVFGSTLDIYSDSTSNRVVTFPTGSSTVSSNLRLNAANSGNITATSTAGTELHISGNLDYVGAGSGSENIDHTSSVWYVSGNADLTGGVFTEPTASSTWIMDGSSKTLTAIAPFSNLDLPGSITFGSNASSTGNIRLSSSVSSGSNTLFMNGATKTLNITGGSLSINNLNIISGASTTISTNDLTVSDTLTVAGALQVNSPRVVTSGSGTAGTLTLTGTIHGTGTTTIASSTLGTSGVLNSAVRFDISSASSTMPARTYGGNVEVYHNSATSRGLLMAAGTHTLNSALIMNSASTGNGTLDGGSNNSTLTVAGASIYIGAGSGREIMTAGTNNWTFSSALNISGGTFRASSATTSVAGNYTNNDGLFTHGSGAFLLNGSSQQTITGLATGTSAFYDLAIQNTSGGGNATTSPSVIFANHASTTNTMFVTTANVTARFPAVGTSTFQNINWNGQGAGTEFKPRSSISGDRWAFRVPGSRFAVTRVDFMDADECDESQSIDASDGTNIDSGNNNCISFSQQPAAIVSADNQVFAVGQSATTISQITITAGGAGGPGGIMGANELRIGIATSSALTTSPVNMRWDSSLTIPRFSGTASTTKVTDPVVSYTGDDSVLLVQVGSNFASGETLIINDLKFTNFGSTVASSSALVLLLDGATDYIVNATNTAQYVAIKGTQVLANSSAGQEANKLDITQSSVSNVELFAFRLTPASETASTTQIVVSLSAVTGHTCADITNLGLYIDYDSSGSVNGSETATGTPTCSISDGSGTLTFATTLATSTARDFIVRSDIGNNTPFDTMNISLTAGNITTRGVTSIQSITPSGSVTSVTAFRGAAHSGGSDIDSGTVNETPTGGGTGQTAGGDINPPPPGPTPPPTGGGTGETGGGGDLPYVPSLLRPLASLIFGAINLFNIFGW